MTAEALAPLAADSGCQGTPSWKASDDTTGDFFWIHKTCYHCRLDGKHKSLLGECIVLIVCSSSSL